MDIKIEPVGYVISDYDNPANMPIHGKSAIIELDPKYVEGLTRIEQNSHLWILSWFHQANRDQLLTAPVRIDPKLPKFGVFSLRAPIRPNPIGLSLVEFDRVEGNRLYVSKFDAVDGTPILDIKPYFQKDIVFSPETPDIRPATPEMKKDWFIEEALRHHQELCADLMIGVRMAVVADERLGKISNSDISLHVSGSACLIDTLQGLSRARVANPPRFSFEILEDGVQADEVIYRSVWRKGEKALVITCIAPSIREKDAESIGKMSVEELFSIQET